MWAALVVFGVSGLVRHVAAGRSDTMQPARVIKAL